MITPAIDCGATILTQAEADVCGLIVQGMTAKQIAAARGTSPITTKNQIAVRS